jgi:hypothetical protein
VACDELYEAIETGRMDALPVFLFIDNQYTIRAADGMTRVKANKKLVQSVQQSVQRLRSMVAVTLLWVPGHADIPGNETADGLAKRGANGVTSDKPIDRSSPPPNIPRPPPPERKRRPEALPQAPQLVGLVQRRSTRDRKDGRQMVPGVDFSMAHASKKKPEVMPLGLPVKCPHDKLYDYSNLNSMIDQPSAGLDCPLCRQTATNLVTLPAEQEIWINVDDDAYELDFDGTFARVYDSFCEPGMDYNPLEFMKYDLCELDLDIDLQASPGRPDDSV